MKSKVNYRLLDGITSADIAFESRGKNLSELFKSSALALMSVQIENINNIKPRMKRSIILEESDIKHLLFKFLNELVFLKDRDGFVFNRLRISLKYKDKLYLLTCSLFGNKINKSMKQIVDVKGVSMHKFGIRKKNNFYYATVVLDV